MKKEDFNRNWTYCPVGKEEKAERITLPHDAMIHQERIPRLKNGSYTGFYPCGDYYYIKRFFAEENLQDQSVIVEFEGVYMDSTVWLNGEEVGGHVYGYSNFYVDLTGKLKIGEENELKVLVHASQVPNARWYPGNGIYRPVSLYTGASGHILPDGICIQTVSISPAVIRVQAETSLAGTEYSLFTEIYERNEEDPEEPGRLIAHGEGNSCIIEIPEAKLWDTEHPNLYLAIVHLYRDGKEIDAAQEEFGIRSLSWNAEKGLLVNGESVKLRGGCVHHDNGILGACEFEQAAMRRVRIMKEAGFNAIRSSHYPLSKEMLRACDRLGMYVMDEAFDTWRENGGLYGYALYFEEEWQKDLRNMIRKDRNHPSVIMYSIGNEITDTARPEGVELTKIMTEFCHSIDDTRPVTVCPNVMMNMLNQKGINLAISDQEPHKEDVTDPLLEEEDSQLGGSAMINIVVAAAPAIMKWMLKPKSAEKGVGGCFENVDIAGYNYGHSVYEGHHKMHPERIMVGSETMPPEIVKNWALVEKYPYVIGDFMWTGWDYLGEAGAGFVEYGKKAGGFTKPYPARTAYTGVIDLTGHRDALSYLAGTAWGLEEKPYIGVRPINHYSEKVSYSGYRNTDVVDSWTWPDCDGKKTEVSVFGRGYTAELFINGKSQGRKKLQDCVAKFRVIYYPGAIRAVIYDIDDRVISYNELYTAEEDTILSVSADRSRIPADESEIVFLDAEITDKKQICKMLSDKQVTVTVEGPGTLQGIGSADPKAMQSYVGNQFWTYRGRMQAIIRSTGETGEIHVTFSANGLPPETVTIHAE